PVLFAGSEVEPDVPVHHLPLQPLDEGPLLSSGLDSHLLGLVGLYQAEQVINGVVHGLAGTNPIYPEPVSIGIVGPNANYRVIRGLLLRSCKISGDIKIECMPISEKLLSGIPPNLRILDQAIFFRSDAKHQFL